MRKISLIIITSLFIFSFILLFIHLFQGELFFDSDIGRDFLLFQDVLKNKQLALIGPRADGISGMFFGPYWIYMNIPIFLLSGGNPIAIAYSWMILVILSIISVFYVTKRIFNEKAAIISSLIFSFAMVPYASGFTQSFMAVLLAPWLAYSLSLYLKKSKPLFLIITLLICGTIYQFQPAFGMITIPTTVIITLFFIIKNKKYKHIFYYFFLLVPFTAYFLFELKHNFLQTNAFLNHILTKGNHSQQFLEILKTRIEVFLNIFNPSDFKLLGIFFFIIFLYVLYKLPKDKKSFFKNFYIIFFSYIFGFLIISFLFKGRFNDYHTWGFLPLTSIAFAGLYKYLNRKIYIILISLVLLLSIITAINYRVWWNNNFLGKSNLSWISNNETAEYVFSDSKNNFGYYIFSLDEFGYHMKYAMDYEQKKSNLTSNYCKKENITYLIYYADISTSISDPVFWKKVRVGIDREPDSIKKIDDIVIEKYILSDKELEIPSDPNLICNLHFR